MTADKWDLVEIGSLTTTNNVGLSTPSSTGHALATGENTAK